jgi:hypothetical protein
MWFEQLAVSLIALQAVSGANLDEETLFHLILTHISPFNGINRECASANEHTRMRSPVLR